MLAQVLQNSLEHHLKPFAHPESHCTSTWLVSIFDSATMKAQTNLGALWIAEKVGNLRREIDTPT